MSISEMAFQVKEASIRLAAAGTELKNKALENIARLLMERKDEIIKANNEDLQRSREEKLAEPLLKRFIFFSCVFLPFLQYAESFYNPVNYCFGTRRTARYINIHRNDFVDPSRHIITFRKNASSCRAYSNGHNNLWVRHLFVKLLYH